jgi:hypothetical protein
LLPNLAQKLLHSGAAATSNGRPRRQGKAWHTYRVGVPQVGSFGAPHSFVSSRTAARARYNRQPTLARHSLPDSLQAWLYIRRGTTSATLTMSITRPISSAVRSYTTRTNKVRYKLEIAGCNNPWANSMCPYMQRLHDTLGAKTLQLLTATRAKSTSDTYGSAIKPYFEFCED